MKHQNPIGNLYDDILLIIKSLVIKYRSKAIVQDTFDIRRRADRYMDALEKKDTFMTYRVFTVEEYEEAGIKGYDDIKKAVDDPSSVPAFKQERLLLNRRKKEVESYVEYNKLISQFLWDKLLVKGNNLAILTYAVYSVLVILL